MTTYRRAASFFRYSPSSKSRGLKRNPRVVYATYRTPNPSQTSPAYFVHVCKLISNTRQNTNPNPGTNASTKKFRRLSTCGANQKYLMAEINAHESDERAKRYHFRGQFPWNSQRGNVSQ